MDVLQHVKAKELRILCSRSTYSMISGVASVISSSSTHPNPTIYLPNQHTSKIQIPKISTPFPHFFSPSKHGKLRYLRNPLPHKKRSRLRLPQKQTPILDPLIPQKPNKKQNSNTTNQPLPPPHVSNPSPPPKPHPKPHNPHKNHPLYPLPPLPPLPPTSTPLPLHHHTPITNHRSHSLERFRNPNRHIRHPPRRRRRQSQPQSQTPTTDTSTNGGISRCRKYVIAMC